jgi:large subunit ribosomal protein L25
MFKLQAKTRDAKKGLESLRKSGSLPAVFYGMGKKSTAVVLDAKEFEKVWKKAGESSTVTLSTPSGDVETLIHDVQVDPVKDFPIHVDFLAIDINKAIKVKVHLDFTGVSDAVKSGAGILIKVMHELEIEALPKNLPHGLKVDISKLKTLSDQILVKDIILPEGVSAVPAADSVVAAISEQKEEAVEVAAAPVDLSAIEVEKKGKKEEEGAEAAPAEKK